MKPHITVLTRALIVLTFLCAFFGCSDEDLSPAAALEGNKNSKLKSFDTVSPEAFKNPPREARPGAYWCWLNGTVDHEQMTREMEEAKALGMRGLDILDVDFKLHAPKNTTVECLLKNGEITKLKVIPETRSKDAVVSYNF